MYLVNWMRARCGILAALYKLQRYEAPSPNMWRMFLGRFPEKTEEENRLSREAATTTSGREHSQNQREKRQREREEMCAFFNKTFGFDKSEQTKVTWRKALLPHVSWDSVVITQADLEREPPPERIVKRCKKLAGS